MFSDMDLEDKRKAQQSSVEFVVFFILSTCNNIESLSPKMIKFVDNNSCRYFLYSDKILLIELLTIRTRQLNPD